MPPGMIETAAVRVVEIENDQDFVVAVPAAHSKNAIFFEADDVHFVFAQALQRRHGLRSAIVLCEMPALPDGSGSSSAVIQLRTWKMFFVLRIGRLAFPFECSEFVATALRTASMRLGSEWLTKY